MGFISKNMVVCLVYFFNVVSPEGIIHEPLSISFIKLYSINWNWKWLQLGDLLLILGKFYSDKMFGHHFNSEI